MSSKLNVIRLNPGVDLKAELENQVRAGILPSGFIVGLIGSLKVLQIRLAGETQSMELQGPLEVCSAQGSMTKDGVHLHLVVSDHVGKVTGGHLGHGSIVHTTIELAMVSDEVLILGRAHDPKTGYKELVVK